MRLDRFGGADESYIIIHLITSDQEDLLSGPVTSISPLRADFSVTVKRRDEVLVSAL